MLPATYRFGHVCNPLVLLRFLSVLLVVALGACGRPDFEEYRLGTAALGGAYYPLGQGIASLVTQHAPGIAMVPIVQLTWSLSLLISSMILSDAVCHKGKKMPPSSTMDMVLTKDVLNLR